MRRDLQYAHRPRLIPNVREQYATSVDILLFSGGDVSRPRRYGCWGTDAFVHVHAIVVACCVEYVGIRFPLTRDAGADCNRSRTIISIVTQKRVVLCVSINKRA